MHRRSKKAKTKYELSNDNEILINYRQNHYSVKKIDSKLLDTWSIPMCFIPLPKKYQLLMNYKKTPFTEVQFSNLTVGQLWFIRNELLDGSQNFYENIGIKLLILDLTKNLSKIIHSNRDYIALCQEIKNELDSFIEVSPYENRQILRSFIQGLSHHGFITDKLDSLNELKLLSNNEFFKSTDNLTLNYYDLSIDDLALLKLTGVEYGDSFTMLLDKVISFFNCPNLNQPNNTIVNFLIDGERSEKKGVSKLKNKIVKFLISLLSPTGELLDRKFITKAISNNLNFIDKLIVKYIEEYLFTLSTADCTIITATWGFNSQHRTLQSLGEEVGVSREWIRQKILSIKNGFKKYCNNVILPNPCLLVNNLMENQLDLLSIEFPILFKCFNEPHGFYTFLATIAELNSDSDLQHPINKKYQQESKQQIYKTNLFEEYFVRHKSPTTLQELVRELKSLFGYDNYEALVIIEEHIANSFLRKINDEYFPINLSGKGAVAHALIPHKDGLPWQDIVKIINKNGYSSIYINEDQLPVQYFPNSDLVYLCSRGVYRNILYLNENTEFIDTQLLKILTFLEKQDYETLHLNSYYNQHQEIKDTIGYFDLRHLIRTYGESYGIFFNGKSGTDQISLKKQSESISQKDVILRALNQSQSGMTKEEIAKLLVSKSIGHASLYLYKLLNHQKVIRIDKTMYSTPEMAFKNIDTSKVLFFVNQIVNSTNKIVEVDIFREEINKKMNLSYSKYFYGSLIKLNLGKLGLYNQRHLFSKEPISFNSLQEIFLKQCLPELSFEDNFIKLQEILLLTREVAYSIIVINGPRFFIENKSN